MKLDKQQNPVDLFIHTTIFVVVDKHARLRGYFETGGDGVDWTNDVQPRLLENRPPTGKRAMTLHDLPAVNASLNGLSAVFLTARIFLHQARQKNRAPQLHDFGVRHLGYFSGLLFDVSRLSRLRLASRADAVFGTAWFRPVYLVILLTHTILAVVIVPLILITLWRAKQERFELHKKIARWTWPLWMYVSVTGVVVYLLLYQIFPQK